ncbi:hypothetical protein GCM10017674_77650 [Streptomyces gardneri]|uniref:Uncharacterized protein n=1 Tax=Streptomyces gardneri TaxID=66892 RepID=A0A4Y3RTK8_9ACTN|nr:hypothetical protein SGA01_68760 [Streptomyces gardneri]GHH22137.1 hypothetical protein GCM10017674_77650 [Streptomyces gardneri]
MATTVRQGAKYAPGQERIPDALSKKDPEEKIRATKTLRHDRLAGRIRAIGFPRHGLQRLRE